MHPIDNTSDCEPDQPGIASNLVSGESDSKINSQRMQSQAGKTGTTFNKSQDDVEPEMPVIGSEFQS